MKTELSDAEIKAAVISRPAPSELARRAQFISDGIGFDENSQRVLITDGRDAAAFIEAFRTRYKMSYAMALEAISDVQEEFAPEFHSAGNGSTAADPAAAARELLARIKAFIAELIKYPGDMKMFARAGALRLGFNDIAGGNTMVDVAKKCSTDKHNVSKQAFEKCFSRVEDVMNLLQYPKLPALPGQRDDAGKKRMAQAQERIWAGENNKTKTKL